MTTTHTVAEHTTDHCDPTPPTSRRRRRLATPAAALTYLLAWVLGLSIVSSSTDVRSSGAEIVDGIAAHVPLVTTQYLLTELLAGLALAAVVAGTARRLPAGRGRLLLAVAGSAAAAVSVVQGGLGVVLTESAVRDADQQRAETLFTTLNQLDGVKMVLLAAALAGLAAAGRDGSVPRWLRRLALTTVPTLAVSAVGYLAADDTTATAAWVSLPLLLATVVGAGLTVRRR